MTDSSEVITLVVFSELVSHQYLLESDFVSLLMEVSMPLSKM